MPLQHVQKGMCLCDACLGPELAKALPYVGEIGSGGVTAQREKLQAEVGKLLGKGHYMWYALRCVADSQPGMTVAELRRFLESTQGGVGT